VNEDIEKIYLLLGFELHSPKEKTELKPTLPGSISYKGEPLMD
jgi:hypothetical protein